MLLQSSKNDAYEHAMSRRQRLDEKGIFGHDANTIRAEHSMRTELMPREVVLLAADVEPKKEAMCACERMQQSASLTARIGTSHTYEAAGPGPDAPPQPDGHPASDECIKGQAENAREDRRAARDVGQATPSLQAERSPRQHRRGIVLRQLRHPQQQINSTRPRRRFTNRVLRR